MKDFFEKCRFACPFKPLTLKYYKVFVIFAHGQQRSRKWQFLPDRVY